MPDQAQPSEQPHNPQPQQDPKQPQQPESQPHDDGESIDDAINARLNARENPQPELKDEPARKELPRIPPNVYASIHRREQDLQKKQAEYAKREAELAEREGVFKNGQYSPFEALKLIGYEDPKAFLEKIAENGGEWTPEQRKLHDLEKKYADAERREQQRQQQVEEDQQAEQVRQLIDNWHNDIAKYTRGSTQWKDALVGLPGTEKAVFNVIQNHYRETGERMEFEDACTTVNAQMEDELKQACQSIGSSPRGRQLLQEYVASLNPQPKRGTSTRNPNAVRHETRSDPLEDMDLDQAIAATIAQRRAQSR